MKIEYDHHVGTVRILATTEEDRTELMKFDRTLDGLIGHANYTLKFVSASLALSGESRDKDKTDVIVYSVVEH